MDIGTTLGKEGWGGQRLPTSSLRCSAGLGYPGIDKSNPSGDGRAAVGKVYHDLRRTSPEGARLLVRKELEQQGGNVGSPPTP